MNDTEVLGVTIDRSRHTVLVVDDNPATRYATGRVLRAAGFPIIEVASGSEAIEHSARGVSAVVLDVHLPDIDGFSVCRAIRGRPSTEALPIVHVSATHVASEDRVTGLNAGADAYMVHPAEPAVLVATIQALIRARTAEEKLRRSEQRFRAIYDRAQNGIALLDAQGGIADANPAMLRILGRARDDIVGRALRDFVPAEWHSFAEAAAVEPPWHGEFPLLGPDGIPVFMDWNVSEPIDEGLRVAIATDVSERRELELRRREVLEREQAARATAETHSRTKDDFIAVLSHELRTPLNSIVGWVAIMMRRDPSAEALKGLQAIERNVKAQARIISDILDVSRINSGKLQLEREEVMPAEVVSNGIAALQSTLAEKSIQIDVDLSQAGGEAWMDPHRYQQVFWNLMTNAVKFSPRGGTVRVNLRRLHDRLVLTVQDEGEGIPPEFLPRLFDRFSQSASPGNRRHGGLGLGLSIVKHLVDLHSGSVMAHSEGSGKGTTMIVDIPVAGAQAADRTEFDSSEGGPDAEPAFPLEDMDILVVEDDPGAREMLAVVLSDRGAKVRSAPDAGSALAALQERWPSALISDIGLPGRDGYELIRAVRAISPPAGLPRRLPAVALTAFARPEDKARALAAGFDAHVAKPLKPHALVRAVLSVASPRRKPD